MGLFSAIGNVLSDMSEQSNNARAEAEKLSTKSICNQLRYAGFSESSGYLAVLRERSREMSDQELIDLLEELQVKKNAKALGGIMGEMSDRGLAEWKDGGGIIKYY